MTSDPREALGRSPTGTATSTLGEKISIILFSCHPFLLLFFWGDSFFFLFFVFFLVLFFATRQDAWKKQKEKKEKEKENPAHLKEIA